LKGFRDIARRLLSAILSMCFYCILGCTGHPDRPGDILLISVDTLRADHMDVYGYERRTTPELKQLFTRGMVFERGYSTSSFTTASMISVLSGLLPQEHGVRIFDQILSDECTLITELLPDTYQTAAFVSNAVLSDRGLGIASRFDHFDDSSGQRNDTQTLERGARATTDAVVDWLEDGRDPDRPLFLWVHYMDPHDPYDPPTPWASTFDRKAEAASGPKPIIRNREKRPDIDPLERIDDYDGEIAYCDAEIGRLMAAYGELADLDDALILMTADHGETLAERARWFHHGYHVFEELVRVPLMIRGPGITAGRDSNLVTALDLVPTMLAFAGADIPGHLSGSDLRSETLADRETTVFVESIHGFNRIQWRAAIERDKKWAVRVREGRPLKLKKGFWDLSADPGETDLRAWEEGEGAGKRLLELIERDPDPAGKPASYRRGSLADEVPDALRALGYLE
jgi:arylsulfatase